MLATGVTSGGPCQSWPPAMVPEEIEEAPGPRTATASRTGSTTAAFPAASPGAAAAASLSQRLSLLLHQAIVVFAACVQVAITSSQVGARQWPLPPGMRCLKLPALLYGWQVMPSASSAVLLSSPLAAWGAPLAAVEAHAGPWTGADCGPHSDVGSSRCVCHRLARRVLSVQVSAKEMIHSCIRHSKKK